MKVLTALLLTTPLAAQLDFQTETRMTKPGAAPKLVATTRYRTQSIEVRVDKGDRFVLVRLGEDRAQRADPNTERYYETTVRELRRDARKSTAPAEPFTALPSPPPIQWRGQTLAGISCRMTNATITAYPLPGHPRHTGASGLLHDLGLLEHPAQSGCAPASTLYARLTLTTPEGEFTTEITTLSDTALDPNIFQMPKSFRRSHQANLFKKL